MENQLVHKWSRHISPEFTEAHDDDDGVGDDVDVPKVHIFTLSIIKYSNLSHAIHISPAGRLHLSFTTYSVRLGMYVCMCVCRMCVVNRNKQE